MGSCERSSLTLLPLFLALTTFLTTGKVIKENNAMETYSQNMHNSVASSRRIQAMKARSSPAQMMTDADTACVSCQYFLERVAAMLLTGAHTQVAAEQQTIPSPKKEPPPQQNVNFLELDQRKSNVNFGEIDSLTTLGPAADMRGEGNITTLPTPFSLSRNDSILALSHQLARINGTKEIGHSFAGNIPKNSSMLIELSSSSPSENPYLRGGFMRDFLHYRPGLARFWRRPTAQIATMAEQERILMLLEELCSGRWTSPYLQICLTIVSKFQQVSDLIQTARADEICQRINLCDTTSYVANSAHAPVVGLDAGDTTMGAQNMAANALFG